MNKHSPVTLDDIARHLNVSKVTVSKALRDHSDISPETKKRVREMAEALGYVPNFIARSLTSRKSGAIGLVVPKIAHHFFASAIEIVCDTALENDYEVILMVSQENARREILHIQTLLSMRVDGLLISVSQQTRDTEVFESIRRMDIPIVFFDRVIADKGFSSVTSDDRGGAFMAVEHAIRCGYRRIAHLAGYEYTNIGRERKRGFLEALQRYTLPVHQHWILEGGFAEKDGYDGLRKLFRNVEVPEMIFAVTYPVALGVVEAAREMGLSMPDQLDVISFGGSDYNRYLKPSITCVNQPAGALGKKATEMLLETIRHPESHREEHLVIPVKLKLGDTCIRKEVYDVKS